MATDRTEPRERVAPLVTEDGLCSIVGALPDPLLLVDGEGIIRFVNPEATRLLGRDGECLVGRSFGYPIDVERPQEISVFRPDRTARVMEMRGVALSGHGAAMTLVSLHDITGHVQMRGKLQLLAFVDELTGLCNLRGFRVLARRQLALAQRLHAGAALLYADIDDFKAINDCHGHHAGDRALSEVAAAVRETFREADLVARIGGDEFAVLGMAMNRSDAGGAAARLRAATAAHGNRLGVRGRLSVSIGEAFYDPGSPSSVDQLLKTADEDMYRAKADASRTQPSSRSTRQGPIRAFPVNGSSQ